VAHHTFQAILVDYLVAHSSQLQEEDPIAVVLGPWAYHQWQSAYNCIEGWEKERAFEDNSFHKIQGWELNFEEKVERNEERKGDGGHEGGDGGLQQRDGEHDRQVEVLQGQGCTVWF
jgi:hypothetical protein